MESNGAAGTPPPPRSRTTPSAEKNLARRWSCRWNRPSVILRGIGRCSTCEARNHWQSTRLQEMRARTGERDESVPFDQWMQRALRDRRGGYYSSRVRGVGRHGDFSTSASLSGALGEAIAGWLREQLGMTP